MSTATEQILASALRLRPAERAALADALTSSLHLPTRREVDAAWALEVEERLDAHERDPTAAVDADEVFADIRAK